MRMQRMSTKDDAAAGTANATLHLLRFQDEIQKSHGCYRSELGQIEIDSCTE